MTVTNMSQKKIIASHGQLCEHLIELLNQVELFSSRQVPVKIDILKALDKEALLEFFTAERAVGFYVSGGDYQTAHDIQTETVSIVMAIGVRNYRSEVAALGTEDESGVWNILEAIRNRLSQPDVTAATNISDFTLMRWRSLLARSDMAILGLEASAEIGKPTLLVNQLAFGGGYGGDYGGDDE